MISSSSKHTAAVLGASGFAGGELLRFLDNHPGLEVIAAGASTKVGMDVATMYPHLQKTAKLRFQSVDAVLASGADVLFSSLPHNESMRLLGAEERFSKVIDIGGDFRLLDPAAYLTWFGEEHAHPGKLSDWVYGIPELSRSLISAASRVANPGCYATAVLLAMAPLVESGVIDTARISVFAVSGVSGAGRASGEGFDFVSINENVRPYSPVGHKHIAEMEQELGALTTDTVKISFVPHLVPMTRGIVATCTAPLKQTTDRASLHALFESRYHDEPFVTVTKGRLPETRHLSGTNAAEVAIELDERTGTAIAICALDNLGKGAAGQAVQNMNLMLEFAETAGLDLPGVFP